MKQGTQRNRLASPPVSSNYRAWRIAVLGGCVGLSIFLSWLLFFGVIAGNWWAVAGFCYGPAMAVSALWAFGIENGSEARR